VAKISVKKPSKSRVQARKAPAKPAAKSPTALKSSKASVKAAPFKAAGKGPVGKPSAPVRAVAKAAAKVVLKKPEPVKPNIIPPVKPGLLKSAPLKSASLKPASLKSAPLKSAKSRKNDHDYPPPVTVAAPVPTDGKPRKNQAGLSSKELEHFRELLLAKRRELVGDMSSMEREALRSASGSNLSNLPLHMADMGTDNYEQEFTLGLVEKDRGLLREINQALAKIQDGTYGLCEGTGKPISKPRLEAQPWAKYSIEHARMMERTGMGIRRI
jgi:DnaK suppressor protein